MTERRRKRPDGSPPGTLTARRSTRSSGAQPAVLDADLAQLLELCACPDCFATLLAESDGIRCSACSHSFQVSARIPVLLPIDVDPARRRYLDCYDVIAKDDLVEPLEGKRPSRHEVLRRFVGDVRGKRVLDIGSSDAAFLRQLDAGQKVAFDLALRYLEAIPKEAGILAVCGDAERLPIRAGHFDVIIISDVLEHVMSPEHVVERLVAICRPDTRLIVHVPWEEDLSQYKDAAYEFTHLRSFNSYNFGLLFQDFYERRSRATYPLVISPLPYRLYGVAPRPLYNALLFAIHRTGLGQRVLDQWTQHAAEVPRREWWLLQFYRPVFRMFELRLWTGSRSYRLARWVRRRLRRTG